MITKGKNTLKSARVMGKKEELHEPLTGFNAATKHETPAEKPQATEETLVAKKWNSGLDKHDSDDDKFENA